MKIFGHEPAAYVGVIEAFLALLLSIHLFGLTDESVGLIMAVVTAAAGLLTAYMTHNQLLSALTGFAKAALALAVGYGLHLDVTQTAAIIAFVTVTAGLFLRTQNSPVLTSLSNRVSARSEVR